jgi:hypothetical protein
MSQHPDQLVDRVLTGLRDTQPAAGLEARIAARLTAASQAGTSRNPIFANMRYALAATAMAAMAVLLLATHFHRPPQYTANLNTDTDTKPVILSEAVRRTSRTAQSKDPDTSPRTTTLLTLSTTSIPTKPDPDQIAFAETLAPSRPAPAMPLTAQEQLLAQATSPGQPIEVAELEHVREPMLRAADKAREEARIRQYVRAMLSPLVLAESFEPTSTAAPEPAATTPSTN